MTGLRASNFSSGQGIAYMHESLYAAVGKRLTYVLNIGARAMTKATLNVHAGHDDYHCMDDTGFFQMFAKDAQSVADLNIIAHRIAELALTPGVIAQDGFLTTHLIESIQIPERELIAEFLGRPDDIDRNAHACAADHLRRHAATHSGGLGCRQPGDDRHGSKPRLVHAECCGPASLFL